MVLETKIFTTVEMDAIRKRIDGDTSDPTGAFARARKKLLEIRAWHHTPSLRKRLHSLLKTQRKVREEEPAQPNEEKTLSEFTREIGY